MKAGEEISGGLIVASCDCPKLFELAEEVLDEVTGSISVFIEPASDFSITSWRDDEGFSGGSEWLYHSLIGVKGPIGHQHWGSHLRQQGVSAIQIMSLAGRKLKGDWIAQTIDQRMDFGA